MRPGERRVSVAQRCENVSESKMLPAANSQTKLLRGQVRKTTREHLLDSATGRRASLQGWLHGLGPCSPRARLGQELGLMLCCRHPEILNNV